MLNLTILKSNGMSLDNYTKEVNLSETDICIYCCWEIFIEKASGV